MANHLRRQIREAVATLLTGLTSTGSRVFQSRVQALKDNQLPALLINTNAEEIEFATIHDAPLLQRTLTIEVVVKAKATNDLDDVIDQIMKEVEAKVYENKASYTLNGLVSGLNLEAIDVEMNGEGEAKVGSSVMRFNAVYFNQAATPDVSS